MTGSTMPMATVSIASKNVALPTITRALRCHADSGNASIRPRIFAEAAAMSAAGSWVVSGIESGAAMLLTRFPPFNALSFGRLIRNSWR